jgi:predicted nucleic acid-binding protein
MVAADLGHGRRPWKKRISPKVADCFIATIATNHRVCLIHCDGDFETIKPAVSLQTPDWTAHLRR